MPIEGWQFANAITEYELQIKTNIKNFKVEHWTFISKHLDLPEYFIERHQAKLDWYLISKFQKLGQQFMSKYAHKLDWKAATRHQSMNEQFLVKHIDKVDWEFILKNCKISHHTLVLLIAKDFNTMTKFYFLQQLKGNYNHITHYKVIVENNIIKSGG